MKKLCFGVAVISLNSLLGCNNEALTMKMIGTVKDKAATNSGCILQVEVSKDIELTVYAARACDFKVGDQITIKKDL